MKYIFTIAFLFFSSFLAFSQCPKFDYSVQEVKDTGLYSIVVKWKDTDQAIKENLKIRQTIEDGSVQADLPFEFKTSWSENQVEFSNLESSNKLTLKSYILVYYNENCHNGKIYTVDIFKTE